jgi:hypothetical protein
MDKKYASELENKLSIKEDLIIPKNTGYYGL